MDIPRGQRAIVLGKYNDFAQSYLHESYFERFSRLYDERYWSECALSYVCEKVTDENGNSYSVDTVKAAILRVPYNERLFFVYSTFIRCLCNDMFTEYKEELKPDLAGRIFDLCFLLRERGVLRFECFVQCEKIIATAIGIIEKLITPAMIREEEKFKWFERTDFEPVVHFWAQLHAWHAETQSTGSNEIEEFVKTLVASNPKLLDAIKDIKAGNTKALNSFKGPVIKQFKGKIDISQLDAELTAILNNIQ